MKVQFIGDERLFIAVKNLCFRLSEIHLNYGQIDVADSDEGIHGLILDSKWFRDFFAQSDLILAYRVVVIGPYVDDFSRASFTPNLQYTYIAYSELESKLVPLLESMMASFHHLDRE